MVRAYIFIWAPSMLIFLFLQFVLNDYIEQISQVDETTAIVSDSLHSPLPQTLHKFLQPISSTMGAGVDTPPFLEFLLDFKTIWLLSWLSILVLSTIIIFSLMREVYLPLNKMREAINRLAMGDLNQPIKIEGSTAERKGRGATEAAAGL